MHSTGRESQDSIKAKKLHRTRSPWTWKYRALIAIDSDSMETNCGMPIDDKTNCWAWPTAL
eukprot:10322480-Karenia_brevis.AAC.1